jgi:MFS family permease
VTFTSRIRARSAVLSNSRYRLVFLATLGSALGTYAATIALTSDIDARTDSTWWVSLLFIVTFVPSIFVGLFAGPLVDRLSRKMLLVTSDVLRLSVFAVLPFAHRPIVMIALALVAGVANSFFRPAVLAGMPNLVDEHELDSATTFLLSTEWVAAAIGPVIAGTLVTLSGPHVVYWVNAATFLLSALLILRIPRRLLQSVHGLTRGHWRDLRDGLLVFRFSPALRVALFGFGLTMITTGLVNPSEFFLATRSLGASGGFGFGLLWTGSGLGLVAGSIVVGFILDRHDVLDLYALSFVPIVAGIIGAAAAPNIWIAATAMTMSGFGNGLAFPMTILIIQRYTSDQLRGRAFTVVISIHNSLLGLAMLASSALTEAASARWTYVIGAACAAGSSCVVLALLRGASPRPAVAREAAA